MYGEGLKRNLKVTSVKRALQARIMSAEKGGCIAHRCYRLQERTPLRHKCGLSASREDNSLRKCSIRANLADRDRHKHLMAIMLN